MTSWGLDGMTFVITGAARGIGAATALTAADDGANVIVADIDDEPGRELVDQIRDKGGQARYQHCDVADAEQVANLMRVAAEVFGGIDVLHNNAGTHETMLNSPVSIEDMPLEIWDRVLAVNLRGPWLCARFAVPYLKASTRGPSIINSGSTASVVAFPACLAYGASKGGVAQLTKNLAVELAKYRIRVNCYAPGTVETRMVTDYLDVVPDRERVQRETINTHLVHRLGHPQDVANLVCFLASGQASFVNGVLWLIDGGSLAWRGTVDTIGM